jgi:hypothetical protein
MISPHDLLFAQFEMSQSMALLSIRMILYEFQCFPRLLKRSQVAVIESGKLRSSDIRFDTIWNGPVAGLSNEIFLKSVKELLETFCLFESLSNPRKRRRRPIERISSFPKCGKSLKQSKKGWSQLKLTERGRIGH